MAQVSNGRADYPQSAVVPSGKRRRVKDNAPYLYCIVPAERGKWFAEMEITPLIDGMTFRLFFPERAAAFPATAQNILPPMKRIFASLAAFILLGLASGARAEAPAQPVVPTAKIELFNGKDLTGWVSYLKDNTDAAAVWSVKDGILNCTGKPNGYLRTEKSYANYQVTVEWRFTRAGNTGVLVHVNPPDNVWPMCIECQGMHDHQGDFWIWSGAKVKEPFGRKNGVIMTVPSAEKPVGEWNTYQVVCRADTVTIIVNGQKMNQVTGTNITSGQIGIQSEGAAIEVRRVTLEPLPPEGFWGGRI